MKAAHSRRVLQQPNHDLQGEMFGEGTDCPEDREQRISRPNSPLCHITVHDCKDLGTHERLHCSLES